MMLIEGLLYALGGALVSIIGSMTGIGGGVFMVPLFYHIDLPIEKAVGTSLFVIMFNGISASTSYWRRGFLKSGSWVIMALLMVPSSMVGAEMASRAPGVFIKTTVSIIVLLFGVNLLLRGSGRGLKTGLHKRFWIAPLTGIIAGFIAGLSGIGGGAIITPVLISILSIPVHEAVAASMLSIVASSTSGSIVHIANGNVVFDIAIPFAIGALIGAQIGSLIAARSKPRTLAIIIGVVLIVTGIVTLLR